MRLALLAAVLAAPLASAQDEWNPIAGYNAEIEKIPEDERAWPVYMSARDALADLDVYPEQSGQHPDATMLPDSIVGDWDSLADWLRMPTVRKTASEYRRASQLPKLGMVLGAGDDPVQAKIWEDRYPDYEYRPHPDESLALSAKLPHLGILRSACRHLCAEAALAAIDSEPHRVIKNLRACLNMTAHASQPPSLIGHLVVCAISSKVCKTLLWVLEEDPSLLDDTMLVGLQDQLLTTSQSRTLADVATFDWMIFEDLIRRCTNDAGAVDPIVAGQLAEAMSSEGPPPPATPGNLTGMALQAFIMYRIPSDAAIPMSREPWNASLAETMQLYRRERDALAPQLKLIAEITQPHWHQFIDATARTDTYSNATLLILTLHRHHLRHNAWPETLDAIDPELLAELPEQHRIDPFTGKPLLYKLTDSGPIVYSAGADRDDDNARQLLNADGQPKIPRWIPAGQIEPILKSDPASIDGDWILYPPHN